MGQAKATEKLTKTKVEALKCDEGKKFVVKWDSETRGFGVRVTQYGVKTFILQHRVKSTGQERQIAISRVNDPMGLSEARDEALRIKSQMLAGIDPMLQRKAQKAASEAQAAQDAAQTVTLREVMQDYLLNKRTRGEPLRPTTQRDIERHMTTNLADWLDEPVSTITRDKCLTRFNEITARARAKKRADSERPTGAQANQCFAYLRALLNWAREKYSNGDDYPLLPFNPVERMFKLQKPNPEQPRDGRIPIAKIGAVWNMLAKRRADAHTPDERTAIDYVKFLILTGLRRSEAASLTWDRVHMQLGTFVIPKTIAKNHSTLTFPLTTMLRELLERRPRVEGNPYVFATRGKKSPHIGNPQAAMEAVSKAAGITLSPHDLRRTFDDIAKLCKVGEDERWKLLNHLPTDVHRKHYANVITINALRDAVESMHDWIKAEAAKDATASEAAQAASLPEVRAA